MVRAMHCACTRTVTRMRRQSAAQHTHGHTNAQTVSSTAYTHGHTNAQTVSSTCTRTVTRMRRQSAAQHDSPERCLYGHDATASCS
jgi:hypothetical protein